MRISAREVHSIIKTGGQYLWNWWEVHGLAEAVSRLNLDDDLAAGAVLIQSERPGYHFCHFPDGHDRVISDAILNADREYIHEFPDPIEVG